MRPAQVVKILKEAVAGNVPIEFGSDGGLKEKGGTFGFVMGMTEVPLWDGAGPVDGDPSSASSTRSELFGYAATLELLLLLKKVYHFSVTKATVVTWIDSTGALSRIEEFTRPTPNHCQYPDDADILSHIKWLRAELQEFVHRCQWVKAHQDTDTPYKDLPWPARLNVMADSLATAFYNNMDQRTQPSRNPQFFPSSRVSLLVNGQRITANPAAAIRFHINGTRHRQFLQQTRTGWNKDSVWNSIDFESFGGAYKTISPTLRPKISKLVHGWLNTGTQRVKINKQSSSSCPRCGCTSEDQDHILQCKSQSANSTRYNALVSLCSSVVTKRGSSRTWTVLHDIMSSWLSSGQSPSSNILTKYRIPETLSTVLSTAILEQTEIGWSQAMQGYLSHKWALAFHYEFPSSTLRGLRQTWSRSIITALWQFYTTMWEHRNSVLHAQSELAQMIRDYPIDTKIQHPYSIQDSFTATDRVLFSTSLTDRLSTTRRSKKQWLTIVAKYQTNTKARRIGDQNLLTKYFPKLSRPGGQIDPSSIATASGTLDHTATPACIDGPCLNTEDDHVTALANYG